jgi:1-phosphatidylinositol-3-phosphate 5-kinase
MSLIANSDVPLEQKPLPSLPPPSTPLLSIDSREHLHSFLRKALHEEGLLQDQNSRASEADEYDDDDSDRSWVSELERALDEFGKSIHSGRWLAGIRRARLILKEATDAADTVAELTPRPEENKLAFGEVVQPDGIAGLRVSRASQTSSLSTESSSSGASETAQRESRILRRLGELISSPHETDTQSDAHHLLLTVSPFTEGFIRTRHDAGLDHMPSRASCSFSVADFPITHEGRVGGTVLYGLDNWPGKCLKRHGSSTS